MLRAVQSARAAAISVVERIAGEVRSLTAHASSGATRPDAISGSPANSTESRPIRALPGMIADGFAPAPSRIPFCAWIP